MQIQPITDPSARISSGKDAFGDVGMGDFIKLMIVELQNQDPLNPMDNAQMLAQIGQIREIASNDKLSSTLDSLRLSQGISMASGLIGQKVAALSDENKRIEGMVNRIMIDGSEAKLIVTETVPETTDPDSGKTIPEYTVEHTVSVKGVGVIFNNTVGDKEDSTELPVRLSAAGELIGKSILGMSQRNKIVTGEVKRISMEDGIPMLILTENIPAIINPETLAEISAASFVDHKVTLRNISSVLAENVETAVVGVED